MLIVLMVGKSGKVKKWKNLSKENCEKLLKKENKTNISNKIFISNV